MSKHIIIINMMIMSCILRCFGLRGCLLPGYIRRYVFSRNRGSTTEHPVSVVLREENIFPRRTMNLIILFLELQKHQIRKTNEIHGVSYSLSHINRCVLGNSPIPA